MSDSWRDTGNRGAAEHTARTASDGPVEDTPKRRRLEPRTKAGRAFEDALIHPIQHTAERKPIRDWILAIEAEAAHPATEGLPCEVSFKKGHRAYCITHDRHFDARCPVGLSSPEGQK